MNCKVTFFLFHIISRSEQWSLRVGYDELDWVENFQNLGSVTGTIIFHWVTIAVDTPWVETRLKTFAYIKKRCSIWNSNGQKVGTDLQQNHSLMNMQKYGVFIGSLNVNCHNASVWVLGLQHVMLFKLFIRVSCQESYAAAYEGWQDFCNTHQIKSLLSGKLIL